MVQYDKDNITLFYIDKDGKRVAYSYTQGVEYDNLVKVRDAQLQAIRENTQAVANYQTTLDNVQQSVSAGREVAAPPKPLAKIVSDTGDVSFTPFDPPLKDIVPYKATAAPSSGSIVSANPGVDKQAIMYNMILAIFRKLFPDAQ